MYIPETLLRRFTMHLETNVPHLFLGSSVLMFAQAAFGETWIGAILQGGALILLAGILWVIFKELAPALLRQVRDVQEQRHREHIDYIAALSSLRSDHVEHVKTIEANHRLEMDAFRKLLEAQRLSMEAIAKSVRNPQDKV